MGLSSLNQFSPPTFKMLMLRIDFSMWIYSQITYVQKRKILFSFLLHHIMFTDLKETVFK